MPRKINFRPCRHLFTDGHQCGSPALRGEELCYYHHGTRRPLKPQLLHGHARAALPEPLDLHAIQRGLAELLRLTASETIDLQIAAQLHRQLATSSQNLARIERAEARARALDPERQPVTDYINDPTLGTIAPAAQPKPQPIPQPQPLTSPEIPQPHTEVPTEVQTEVQTQLQPNEDFETSLKTCAEPRSTDNPQPAADLQTPLPDPIFRFLLPPEPECIESKEAYAAGQRVYAEALQQLAEGIHTRAETRARLHASLYPLHDDSRADRDLLEAYPQVHPVLQILNQPQPLSS